MATIDMTIKHDQTLEIEVGCVYSKIIGEIPHSLFQKLDDELSFYVAGYQYSKLYKNGFYNKKTQKYERWDGRQHLLYGGKAFSTGLLDRVKDILKANNYNFTIKDLRKPVVYKEETKLKGIELRDYQKSTIETAIKRHNTLIRICTGGGKTAAVSGILSRIPSDKKCIILVPGLDLLYQTKSEIEKMLGRKVGIIGNGDVDMKQIVVSTIWSAANAISKKKIVSDEEDWRKEKFKSEHKRIIADFISKIELMIVDECHISSCTGIQKIYVHAKNCSQHIGVSGTPYRSSDNADLLIEGIFGKKVVDVPASQLIDAGWLVRPIIHFVDVPESTENLGSNYQSIYKKFIVENEQRNDKIVEIANKLKDAGRRILILVKNIKHGELLLEKFNDDTTVCFLRGETDSEERIETKNEFTKGNIDIIIATSIFDQGVDISNLDGLILACSGKSAGRSIQRIGRAIRTHKGKKDAIVIDFIDNCKYLYKHSMQRLKVYQSEDGFKIKLPKDFDQSNTDGDLKPKKIKKNKITKEGW